MNPHTRFLAVLSLFFVSAHTYGQVNAPTIGFARYSDQTVRRVMGIHAAVVVGDPVLNSVTASSFSDSAGLVSIDGKIRLLLRDFSLLSEYDAGEAAPLLSVEAGPETAIAWLPVTHSLLYWNGKSFSAVEVADPGANQVTSVRRDSPDTANLLLATSNGKVLQASISLDTGNLRSLNLLPGVSAPAFAHRSFIIFRDSSGVEILSRAASIRTVPLHARDVAFEGISSDWLHLFSKSGQHWILHLTDSVEQLSELPAPSQASALAASVPAEGVRK